MQKTLSTSGVLLALAIGATTHAAIINVPGDYPTIQLAINNSQPNDEIVIADGTYVGSFDTFGQSLTIRSASGDSSTVTIVGDDSWTVFVASFETVTIQDVTMRNPGAKGIFIHSDSTVNLEGCHLTLMNGPNSTQGAMVHVRGGSTLSAVNCVFDNSSNVGSGGGIGVTDGASASIAGCTFDNITSSSPQGGAIYVTSGTLSLSDSDFSNTSAVNYGGGIFVNSNASISSLENCSFTNLVVPPGNNCNIAYGGGAIYYLGTVPLTILNCSFEMNSGPCRGGAIFCDNPLLLTDCEFRLNSTTDSSGDGGAVYGTKTVTVVNSDFRENTSPDRGGAIYCGSSYSIADSAFLCNVAAQGGAVYINNVSAPETIENCFFALNEADGGGAILSNDVGGGPGISNTTFCGNHIGQVKGNWTDLGTNLITVSCLATPPIDCDYQWPFASFVCTGDIIADGNVAVLDLLAMLGEWGTPNLTVDLNRDGNVDVNDLLLLLGNWGPCK